MAIKTNLENLKPARERFKKVVPLISRGKSNEKYFPDGAITIYPWDHTIDDFVANRIQRGNANPRTLTYDLLPKLCDLRGCPTNDFLVSEVILVLLVSRGILMNDIVPFSYSCPECHAKGEDKVKVPDNLAKIGEKPENWPGYDELLLADAKDAIRVKPLTVGDELLIINRTEIARKIFGDSVARLATALVSVNGTTPDNAQEACTYINALSPSDMQSLKERYEKLQPGLSTELSVKCDSCGHGFNHALKLDEDFFRRPGSART